MRKILKSGGMWAVALGLAVGAVVATGAVVGHVRHSQDAAWCRKVTPTVLTLKGVPQPVDGPTLAQARAGCVAQRRAQRGVFGAVWKSGGEEMAVCGVDWGRFQQLAETDPAAAAAAVTTPYGLAGPLDAGSRSDQQRFMTACLRAKHTR